MREIIKKYYELDDENKDLLYPMYLFHELENQLNEAETIDIYTIADQEKILNAMHSYDKIHFNVTGFGKFQYSRFDPLGKINYTNYTNWEMHTIFNDSKLLEKTTFYKYNGSSYEILNNYSPKW